MLATYHVSYSADLLGSGSNTEMWYYPGILQISRSKAQSYDELILPSFIAEYHEQLSQTQHLSSKEIH